MSTGYSPVPELNLLKELEERVGNEFLAYGFEMRAYGDEDALRHGWSAEPEFLDRVKVFAVANGTGSLYALWRCDGRSDLATLPVVILGDEGDYGVVADSLRELLLVLAADSEVVAGSDVDPPYLLGHPDYRQELEYAEGELNGHTELLALLQREFGLTPSDDAQALMRAAHERHGSSFREWVEPFLAAPGWQ
ncbi:hypothetical protein F4561_001888 [Lipingzhangella halophila]|uniref:Uncharacterized protein n=1 Tax=Lipingzhangella halophila TaxID=1783352 RepID=A0A7W7RFI0_9ACTN|nr:hypothetical protein [Lipingzhangella halophila]MBB4931068.1 hypothetical protein [Lipingzhangella halophila]